MKKSLYDLLEISQSAEGNAIRTAYRRQMALYHPDKVAALGDDLQVLAEERTKEINAAYTVLSDAHQRAAYDRSLAVTAPPPPPPAGQPDDAPLRASGKPQGSGNSSGWSPQLQRADTMFLDLKDGLKTSLMSVVAIAVMLAIQDTLADLDSWLGKVLGGVLAAWVMMFFRCVYFVFWESIETAGRKRAAAGKGLPIVHSARGRKITVITLSIGALISLSFDIFANPRAYSHIALLTAAACFLAFIAAFLIMCARQRRSAG